MTVFTLEVREKSSKILEDMNPINLSCSRNPAPDRSDNDRIIQYYSDSVSVKAIKMKHKIAPKSWDFNDVIARLSVGLPWPLKSLPPS